MTEGLGLGIRLLALSRGRFLAAFAGVAVAVIIMFVELGLLQSILDSQSRLATIVNSELVVLNRARTNLHKWNSIDSIRLHQIAGIPGVAGVVPLYQGTAGVADPDDDTVRRILVLAFPPEDSPLAIGDRSAIARALRTPGAVLFDSRSRPIFGRIVPGRDVTLDDVSYRVAGTVAIGPDVVNDGAFVMSEGEWLRRHPGANPIMGAIRLKPHSDIGAVRAAIMARMPDDVALFTPDELKNREITFTLRAAPIGILFGIGMLAGLVIGALTCYQILFNEIVDRLPQYATLKAMGFGNGFLRRVVLEQAALLTVCGFALGLVFVWLVFGYIARATALSVELNAAAITLILVLTAGMSAVAGLLALRRVVLADPAELY